VSNIKRASEEYWDDRPCNIRHAQTREQDDPKRWAQEFTDRKHIVEPHIWRWTRFPAWERCRVLILGCGIGTMALEFAKHHCRVEAWDFSEKSLAIAKRRAQHLGLRPWINFVQGDIEKVEPNGMFDLVYSFGVLHHTPAPYFALARARDHLRDDGKLMFMVYYKWAYKWFQMYLAHGHENGWDWEATIRARSEAQTNCPYTTVWDRNDVEDLLHETGYRLEHIEIDHIFPYKIAPYRNYEYELAFPWSWTPGPVFRWMERHFGQHLLVTARKDPKWKSRSL
jgi:SAM-dependent methyltransferase